jgi:hypothetical protein
MHLTSAELEALADGELLSPQSDRARRHLAACTTCGVTLARRQALLREVAEVLGAADHVPPVVSPDDLIARARRIRRSRWPALAAGIAAVGVAIVGAAAVIPRLPLTVHLGRVAKVDSAAIAGQQPAELRASSVGFTPAGVVNVTFASTQSSGEIGVTLSDSPVVRVSHRAGSVSYLVTMEGMLVENAGSGASYEITVPRAAASVHVRVGNWTVFARDGGHIWTAGVPGPSGHYLIRFASLAEFAK